MVAMVAAPHAWEHGCAFGLPNSIHDCCFLPLFAVQVSCPRVFSLTKIVEIAHFNMGRIRWVAWRQLSLGTEDPGLCDGHSCCAQPAMLLPSLPITQHAAHPALLDRLVWSRIWSVLADFFIEVRRLAWRIQGCTVAMHLADTPALLYTRPHPPCSCARWAATPTSAWPCTRWTRCASWP